VLDTGHRVNWRVIAGIAGLAVIGSYLLRMPYNWAISQHRISVLTSREASHVGSGEVTIGQFRCSAKAATEVKRLTPIETQGQLESDKEALDARGRELAQLQVQIEATPVDDFSSSSALAYRDQMIDQYNTMQGTYESDAAALKQRIDTYNSQIEAHDSYLAQHCTSIDQ
jgi:hypothetical protein